MENYNDPANPNYAQQGTPWYFFGTYRQDTGSDNAHDDPARFGYDAMAGWWGLNEGISAPTVFFASPAYPSSNQLLTKHDFIQWVCLNSDYFSRYGDASNWVTPTVSVSGYSIGYASVSENPAFGILWQYQNNGSWVTQETWTVAPYSGAYTVPFSGTWRATFIYGDQQSASSEAFALSVPVVSQISFGSVTVTRINNDLFPETPNYQIIANAQNADTLILQRKSGDTWVNVGYFINNGNDNFSLTTTLPLDYYQILAIGGTGSGQLRATYDLGQTGGSPGSQVAQLNFIEYIALISNTVVDFITHIPDMFLWFPIEIRALLIACIAIMIGLGMIGWLKS